MINVETKEFRVNFEMRKFMVNWNGAKTEIDHYRCPSCFLVQEEDDLYKTLESPEFVPYGEATAPLPQGEIWQCHECTGEIESRDIVDDNDLALMEERGLI